MKVARGMLYRSGDQDPWIRLVSATVVLLAVLAIGTVGYMVLGLSVLEALYQTVITVTTVGFSEQGTITVGYRIFTIVLILVGAGLVLYLVGLLVEILLEGRLDEELRRRRLERGIGQLAGHVIVAGWGQVGEAITREVVNSDQQVVVVDRDKHVSTGEIPLISGDATDDSVLRRAGIGRASTLVVAMNDDANNVYVTLSARAIKPDLFIVARANTTSAEPKLQQAGADRVVNPHSIGGARMAAMALSPNVADFLGVVMHDRELAFRLGEASVSATTELVGQVIESCGLRERTGVTILAIRRVDGEFVNNPGPAYRIMAGDVIIALGTDEQIKDFQTSV